MPTLNWIGKDKVVNHHQEVPYKVLEHQYTYKNGKEVNDSSENKIIHGDNLEALKSLLPEYEGKIDCIYIDPPYNTGNEGWVYNDNVTHPRLKKWLGQVVGKESEDLSRHDKWLCMMYPRLKLLHKLLSKSGAIFISIDDNEHSHLRLLLDEIFGLGNFVVNICWRKTDNQANIGQIANVKEYIVCYSKNKKLLDFNKVELSEKAKKEYRYKDKKGNFRRDILFHKTRGRNVFNVITPNGNTLSGPWMIKEDKFRALEKKDEIYWASGKMETPYGKLYLEDSEGQIPNDNWGIEVGSNQQASVNITNLFGKRVFDFSKPYTLIEFILSFSTNENSLILDSFAGSGSTGHAVLNLNKEKSSNRKFILIEMEDYANEITAERVKKVIGGYGKDSKKVEGTGGDFSYYELGQSLFDTNDMLNENVELNKILEYVWYSETKTPYVEQKEDFLLGSKEDTAYYFYYIKEDITTLDLDYLRKIKTKASQYIIYADNCLLDKKILEKYHIIFKKIPRDISRF